MQVQVADIKPMASNVVDANESKAQINIDGFAFQALSGRNLYKNLIRAIIRELACNAYDAHVMAGNQDKAFSIHLPTALEPFFSIRDYGIGLDDAGVRDVYMTYFGSTKRKSQNQIGAWGLGSKSPLGYTDNFTVNAFKDGVQRIYVIYKDETGVPSVRMICESPTDEPNGIEVQMPVTDSSDFNRFRSEAEDVLRWFPVAPNFNVEVEMRTESYTNIDLGCGVRIYSGGNNSHVVHGMIAYPVDHTMFSGDVHGWIKKGIEITVENGAVDFSMSREELSYNDKTKAAIEAIVNQAMMAFTKSVIDSFDNLDPFDQYVHYDEMMSHRMMNDTIKAELRSSGVSIIHNMLEADNKHLRISNFCVDNGIVQFERRYIRGRYVVARSEFVGVPYPTQIKKGQMVFVINDEKSRTRMEDKIRYSYKNKNTFDNVCEKIVVVPADKVELFQNQMLSRIFKNVTFIGRTSELHASPKQHVIQNATKNAQKSIVGKELTYSRGKVTGSNNNVVDLCDFVSDFVYITKGDVDNMYSYQNLTVMADFVGHNRVYLVADNKVKKLEKMSNAHRLFDLFKVKVNELNESVKKDGVVANFDSKINAVLDLVDDGSSTVSGSVSLPHNILTIQGICTQFGMECAWKAEHTRHHNFEKMVYQKYPLLSSVESYNVTAQKDAIRDYVMAINLLNASKVVDNA